jgi:hypothetical protein
MGWIHNSHFTDNKLNDKCISDVTVDIGKNKDWSISDYLEDCQITIEGDKYLEAITEHYYDDKNIHKSKTRLEIPKQKDGSKYSLKKTFKTTTSSCDSINRHNSEIPQKQQKIITIASNCYGLWGNWKIIHYQYNHFHCKKYDTNE